MLTISFKQEITQFTLLCLRYRLADIDFHGLFQEVFSFFRNIKFMKNNLLIIQLITIDIYDKREKGIKYLKQKSKNMFDSIVYLRYSEEFVKELQKNLRIESRC